MNKIDNIIQESINKVLQEELYREPLLEMARIDEPSKDGRILGTKEVWIYGNDRSSMSPHFHYYDKKNNPFHVEVKIEDLTVCHSAPRDGIPQNRLASWDGLSNEYRTLRKWLNASNSDMPTITNYQALKLAWNQNNRNNKVELQ